MMTASLRADATTPEENGCCKRLVQAQMVWPRSEGPIRTFEAVAAVQDVREGESKTLSRGAGDRSQSLDIANFGTLDTWQQQHVLPYREEREKGSRVSREEKAT